MTYNKKLYFALLNYKNLIEQKYKKNFCEFNLKEYYNLQYQLSCIKDFLVWKRSFLNYLKLFYDYKVGLINVECLIDKFFEFYNSDKKFIKNYKFTPKIVQKLIVDPKSFGFWLLLENLALELEVFEDEFSEEKFKIYTTKVFSDLELFFDIKYIKS